MKRSVEQEIEAVERVGRSTTPIAVLRMDMDLNDQKDLPLVRKWCRHDAYLAMITGAKGIIVWSGWRRPTFKKNFDDYYAAYASVSKDLNGPADLGKVILFGERKTDITLDITSGPKVATVTKPSYSASGERKTNITSGSKVKPAYSAASVNFLDVGYGTSRYLLMTNSANEAVGVTVAGLPEKGVFMEDIFAKTGQKKLDGGSFDIKLDSLEVKCFRFTP